MLGRKTRPRDIGIVVMLQRSPLWHQKQKPRAKFSEKITWNGLGDSFLAFRRGIEGHLYQVGAGYLIDPHFLQHYILDPQKYQYPIRMIKLTKFGSNIPNHASRFDMTKSFSMVCWSQLVGESQTRLLSSMHSTGMVSLLG